jgi:rhodanese-related sulfurtransferase
MKRTSRTRIPGLLLTCFLLSGCSVSGELTGTPPADIETIGLIQARRAHDNRSAVFLDVRGAGAYSDSHIPGAISIPLNELELRLPEIEATAWVIIYCDSLDGRDSRQAFRLIAENGVGRAETLTGGFEAWISAGFPVDP